MGSWRKLHKEELHILYEYVSPNIIRMLKTRRTCSPHRREYGCTEGFGGEARSNDTTRKSKT
jgi:hypothetical protein